MQINVLTPERELFAGKIVSVKVPGASGRFQVFKNHAPIVSSLTEGTIEMVTEVGSYRYFDPEEGDIKKASEPGKVVAFQIEGGFVEVLNNNVTLLVQIAGNQG